MRVIRRFFRKQFSPIIILLSLFLNTISPFVSLLPKSIAHAQDAGEVAPSVSLSFDFPSNNFVMKAQGVSHASYTLKYTTVEGKDVGVENAEAKLEEKIFAGTCSKDDCVKDSVRDGQFSFEGLYGDMRTYKKVISFKVVNGTFWTSDTSKWSTNDVVLGHEYKAPQNDGVSVTFTKLPEKTGSLSIEEITLSDEQVKSIGALSNTAYDITSDMKDGEFEYVLTLPNIDKNMDAKVQFSEDGKTFTQTENVSSLTDSLVVKNLNHFTIFVVTNDVPPLSGAACVSAGASAGDKCFNTIQNAIEAAASGDVINLLADFDTTSQISVTKSLTINGNGHTIWPHFIYTDNSNNAAIHIYAQNVVINDLKIDGTFGTSLHGINLYVVDNVVFDTVSVLNNDKSGITVNGSNLTARNITTSGNGWGGINVDQGSGVTTPSILTISKTSQHQETNHIWIDNIMKDVHVVDVDHQYTYTDIGALRIYSLDITPPTVPVNGLPNASILNTNNFDFIWSFATDDNTPVTYEFQSTKNPAQTGGVLTNSLWHSGILPSNTIHSSGASDGTWYWQVRAIDAAGNKSAWSQIWTVTLDTTKPVKPTGLKFLSKDRTKTIACGSYVPLQVVIPDWNDITGDPTFSHYEYTSFHPNGAIGLNEQVLTVSELDNSWMPPADGAYGYAVRSVDTAGNISDWAISAKTLQGSCQVIYDSVKPTDPGVPTTTPNPTNSLTQAWSWLTSLDTHSGVKGYYQRILNVLTSTYSGWTWVGNVLGVSTNLNDGEWKMELQAEDNAGNRGGVVTSQSLIVDSIPPDAPTLISPANNAVVQGAVLTNSWSSVSGAVKYTYQSYNNASATSIRWTETTTNTSKTATNVANATFWWRVKAIDAVGNESAWSPLWKVTIDNTKPTVDLVFQTPGPSATSFNAVFNESVKQSEAENPANYFLHNWPGAGGTGNLSGHATVSYNDTTHTATVTFTTPGWYLSAEQEWGVENIHDLAGNIQSVNPYKETTTTMVAPNAPGVPVTSPDPTNSSSQVWTYAVAVDPGGVNASGIKGYWYKMTGDMTTAFVSVGNMTSITTNLPEGSYTLHIKAEDNAGNVGPESTGNVLVDTTSPINPTVSSTTHTVDVWSQTPVLTMSWSGASDVLTGVAGYSYVLDSSALTVPDTISEGNGTSATSGTLSDGQYYFHLRTVDGAGNWSDPVHVGPFKLDGTTPESVITSPVNSGTNTTVITNSWDGAIEGTATDATSGIDYVALSIQRASDGFFYNGEGWSAGTEETVRVTATGTTSWSFTLPEPSEDSYTIKSHAVDLAGNIENTYTLTIVLDKTIPEVSITLNPVNPDGSNNWYKTNPTITLTANDNYDLSRIEYQWDSTVGSWTTYVNPFQVPSEGQHVLYYRSLDTAGNFSETGIKNIKYDATNLTEGPLHVSVSPDPTSGSTATVKWDEATDNTGINKYEVTWSLNGVSYTHTVGGDVRKDDIDKLTEGVWKITVKAFDGVGNSKEASVNLTVDRTAPQPPVLTLTGTGVGTASLSWNSVSGATDYIVWYGTTPGARTYGARVGNVTSYTVGGLAGGTYYFVVRSVDSVNNQSGDSNEVSTGSITGAPGALPNQPVQGFAPEVLGAATESGELTQPDGTNEDTAQGSVLGETTISNLPWWIIPLLAVFFFMIFFYLKKRKNQE